MNYSLLVNIINKHINNKSHYESAIKGLSFYKYNESKEAVNYLSVPHLCLVIQGLKHISLGTENYVCSKNSFILSSVDLPLVSKIEATNENPYLGIVLEIDLLEITQMMSSETVINDFSAKNNRGIGISKVSEPLFDAIQRLLVLLDNPKEIPFLESVIKKEIYYRLLTGNQGYKLKQIISEDSNENKISKVTRFIKNNFYKQLHIKNLSDSVGMSESSFFHHFKELTTMSPLQYQKKIRLNEAKKLMLLENIKAGDASFKVGYDSVTQFNREYKRMFGNPPKTDIKQIKEK